MKPAGINIFHTRNQETLTSTNRCPPKVKYEETTNDGEAKLLRKWKKFKSVGSK